MTKSLIIDLGLGNLEQDTPVRIKLWWNSEQKRADEYNTNLPPDTILSRLYKIWQKLYNIRYQTVSSRSSVTLLTKKPTPTYIRRCPQWNFDDLWQNIDNLSDDLNDNNLLQQVDDFISLEAGLLDLCENINSSDINKNLALAQQKLEERFNVWLQYQEFINCQHQWDKNEFLDINDEIFVIFQIQDHLIRKLPWHQWNFFDKYPLATHGFGSLSYQGRFVRSKSSNQVEILAILCDDEGIDLQQERIIFDQLVNDLDVKIDFMTFPFNRKQLEERLEKGCDILFFAGHSKTQSESGHIYINDQESVTINDLNNSFEAAIDHGLRLAIFNSCDGLGLANDLAKLNISHVIVMKEQVSNFIAQEFFRYFLEFFAQEKYPIFLAVQEARNKLKKHELQHPGASFLPAICINPAVVEPLTWENLRAVNTKGFHADWGNVPPVNHFFGRTEELEKLKQWIVNESCRVLAIVGSGGIGKTGLSVKLGQGGIGKTDLSVKLARGMQGEFDYIIWRSLLNAPPFIEIITDIVKFLSHQQETNLPESPNIQINTLLGYLKQNRCLLIFDNIESILEDGKYRHGYGVYGEMFQQIRQQKHQSCLLLTSRVIPPEIESRRYKDGSVRLLELTGLRETEAVKKIFQQIGEFRATDENWEKLIEVYGGNPLFLELSAGFIKEQYQGNIAIFLEKEQHLLEKSIEDDLLNWHFQRLNKLEKEIIYWLAINREPVSESELLEDLLAISKSQQVNKHLQSLKKKIPLEKIVETSTDNPKFTLQPVIIEYITKRLINQMVDEIRDNQIELFNSHALFKAQGKEYIKDMQIRLILKPVIEQLLPKSEFRNIDNNLNQLSKNIPQNHLELIEKIRSEINNLHNQVNLEYLLIPILFNLKKQPNKKPGYAAGNLLNLLIQEQIEKQQPILNDYDLYNLTVWQTIHINLLIEEGIEKQQPVLNDYDFSYLTVWQTDFTRIHIHNINFTQSKFRNCLFIDNFGSVLNVQFSPDGKLFAGCDINEQIRIWRMEDNQLITICDGHNDYVLSISFSPDTKLIASSSIDKTVKIWEVNTGKLLKTLKGHTGWVITVKFSPDGKTIASCGGDGIKIWNIENGECLKTLPEQETGVFSIDFSPDGKELVSGSPDTTIKMWDVETGKLLQSLPGLNKLTSSVSFSPNGKLLANSNGGVTYKDKEEVVKIWEFKDGKWQHIQTLTENKASVRFISFSPDSQKLVCCVSLYDDSQKYHPIKIYDVNTYEFKTLEGHISLILSTAFHADNQRLVSSSEDETIKVWDINTGKCLKTLYGYTDWQLAIAFHPNGEILASGDNNATVRLWNIKTGKCLKTLLGHKNTIWSLAFSHDGNQLASGSTDTTIKIWDIKTGKCLKTFFGEEERIWSLAFSPNDKKLASSSFNQTINIWDIETGKYQNLKPDKSSNAGIKSVAYSPNGQILISGSEDSTICIWDANTYECLQVLTEHTDRVNSVKFINDQIFVSASEDSTIRLWNLNTYECLKVFRGHQGRLTSVDFNGQILVSGSTDRTVRLWDIKTGECRKILSGHTKRIDTVVFSADGQTVASCSRDGTISLWDMETYNRQILRVPRPYEGMNITGIKGLTEKQKVTLKTLGAVEDY